MDRNLAIGLLLAAGLHGALLAWGHSVPPRPRPDPPQPDALVRTVREQVELPPPPAPPTPPAPEPEAESAPAAEAPRPVAPRTRPVKARAAKPAADKPPPPSDEPPPLLLSQTYGSGGDAGVAVNRGEEDLLGDPGIAPTEGNSRRREDVPAPVGSAAQGGSAGAGVRRVDIVHAVPRSRCAVDWPEGADIGRRIVEVRMTLRVSVTGQVVDARLLRPAGEPFDSAAIRAVKACDFKPGLRDGKPFVDRVPFVVEFRPNGL